MGSDAVGLDSVAEAGLIAGPDEEPEGRAGVFSKLPEDDGDLDGGQGGDEEGGEEGFVPSALGDEGRNKVELGVSGGSGVFPREGETGGEESGGEAEHEGFARVPTRAAEGGEG